MASKPTGVRIDDSIKREVLSRTDIAEYIGQFVTLRRRGTSLVGLCPFHAEKTPSFHVHPDKGFFKCFGCDAHGDVINYLRRAENLTFPEALRVLAKRAGIELEAEDPVAARTRNEKEAIYAANAVAAQYFHRMLTREAAGEPARDYCERRGLGRPSIDLFKLGYAPERWDGLLGELKANAVDLPTAVKAGLLKPGNNGGYYDVYRGRVMIPTYATTGEVIAFGGRALGNEEPKYLNALNAARRAAGKVDAIIVVEGYLDCIALHQAGFTHTVAALGTAFTAEQARELRKVSANVFVCFDADGAGRSATAKSIDILRDAGCSARIVELPPGEDPDSYVRRHGADGFAARLNAAVSGVQFQIDREVEAIKTGFSGAAEVARRAEALVFTHVPSEERDRWRVYIAGRLNLRVDDLRKSRLVTNASHFAPRPTAAERAAPRAGRHIMPGAVEAPSFERDVLAIVLEEPGLLAEYADAIRPERFEQGPLRRIYATLIERHKELLQPSDVRMLFSEDDEASAIFHAIAGAERSLIVRFAGSDDRRAYLDRVVARLRADDLQRRYRELDSLMNRLHDAGESIPSDVRDEHHALAAKLKG
jgi:DNA primase